MKREFDTEAFLAHYGVKGMKWGVRKDGKPQGYQGRKTPNMAVERGISKNFNVSPAGIVVSDNKRSPRKERKDTKYLMNESNRIINASLSSKTLAKNLSQVNKKFKAEGPYFSLNAAKQMDYTRQYMTALRDSVLKHANVGPGMTADIDAIVNSKTNQLDGFVFFLGDTVYVDSMLNHSDEPQGVRKFIKAITDPKTGYISKLKVQADSLKHYK